MRQYRHNLDGPAGGDAPRDPAHEEAKGHLREALPGEFGITVPEHPYKGLSRKLGKAFAKREGRRHGPNVPLLLHSPA
jgi:hypothetical protein